MNRQQRRRERSQARGAAIPPANAVPAVFALALDHHGAGRLGEAEALCRQILAVDAAHADSLHLLGVIAYQVGRLDLAVELTGQAIRIREGEAVYHNTLALALHGLGRADEALAGYRRALALSPALTEAHNNLGNLLQERGDADEAAACYRRALALRPGYPDAHNNLGNALRRLGRDEEAVTEYRAALALRPDYAEALNNLGTALHALGRPEDAIGCYRRALALNPDAIDARGNLGHALKELEQLEDAAVALRQALVARPDDARLWYALGDTLYAMEDFAGAEAAFRRTGTLSAGDPVAALRLCLALQQLGRHAEATAILGGLDAARLDTADGWILLAHARRGAGDLGAALDGARHALDLLKPVLEERRTVSPRPRPGIAAEGARQALLAARTRLNARELPFFPCSGTLLGLIRDGNPLPYDKDLDIGMSWSSDRDRVIGALTGDDAFDLVRMPDLAIENERWTLSFRHVESGIALDVFFFRPDGAFVVYGPGDRFAPMLSRPRAFTLESFRWQEVDWLVPSPPEQYLLDVYGETWRVPDSRFDTVVSNHSQLPSTWPARHCYAYFQLYLRLRSANWPKAAAYCQQILRRTDDPYVADVLRWLDERGLGA